jgi:hypothetical protein
VAERRRQRSAKPLSQVRILAPPPQKKSSTPGCPKKARGNSRRKWIFNFHKYTALGNNFTLIDELGGIVLDERDKFRFAQEYADFDFGKGRP